MRERATPETGAARRAGGAGPDTAPDAAPDARRAAGRAYTFADLSGYTRRERLLIRAADLAFYLLVRLIGSTVRFRVEGWEHWEASHRGGPPVMAFWHDRILLATYYFRGRGIVVMTSQSFDGEYIARFIQRLGYGAARGSSTRGGVGALVEMIRLVRAGLPAGFTVDGPRGPRHVAKTGALLLAKKTGRPVLPFAVNPEKFWTLKSWDRFRIPRPFTRAAVRIAPPFYVPADADDAALEALRAELQHTLEEVSG
ncbi:MAG TPA: lysophospholipid acyltransferase family protein [Pyrinomonadaceae bacterium]|nr:lysophospholipid acyltransferase family protein [Pyrinomonadaceae bacterium]